jgi:hypothetical protein
MPGNATGIYYMADIIHMLSDYRRLKVGIILQALPPYLSGTPVAEQLL